MQHIGVDLTNQKSYSRNAKEITQIIGKREDRFDIVKINPCYLSTPEGDEVDFITLFSKKSHPLLSMDTPSIRKITDFH
jgi:hypothetical protein